MLPIQAQRLTGQPLEGAFDCDSLFMDKIVLFCGARYIKLRFQTVDFRTLELWSEKTVAINPASSASCLRFLRDLHRAEIPAKSDAYTIYLMRYAIRVIRLTLFVPCVIGKMVDRNCFEEAKELEYIARVQSESDVRELSCIYVYIYLYIIA